MRLTLKSALRVASVPVGVGVGLWTTQLWTVPRCPPNTHCPALLGVVTFTPWQSALFGAAAAGWLALVSLVVRSGRNVVSALRVASVPSGVGVWSLDGAAHDVSKLPSQYPFGSVRLLLAAYLRHMAVRLVGRSRGGRRVPRLRSRCATAFPKLRRHPRPSQSDDVFLGCAPLRFGDMLPGAQGTFTMLAWTNPQSLGDNAGVADRLDLDEAASQIDGVRQEWISRGLEIGPLTWREWKSEWKRPLLTRKDVRDPESVGFTVRGGAAEGSVVLFRGGWADTMWWPGTVDSDVEAGAPELPDLRAFGELLDALLARWSSSLPQ